MKFRNNKIEFVESNEEDEEGYMDGEDESQDNSRKSSLNRGKQSIQLNGQPLNGGDDSIDSQARLYGNHHSSRLMRSRKELRQFVENK